MPQGRCKTGPLLGVLAIIFIAIIIILCVTISTPRTERDRLKGSSALGDDMHTTTKESTTAAVETTTTTVVPTSEESTTATVVPTEESTTATVLLTSEETTTATVETTTGVEVTTDTTSTIQATAIPPTDDICTTTACKRLAAKMLHMMDNGIVEPCENFYKFSCGGVMDNPFFKPDDRQVLVKQQIKSNLQKANQLDSMLDPMKTYYNMCLNDSTLHNKAELKNEFYEAFSSIGYSFDYDNHNFDANDATSMFANMMKTHFTPFFDVLLDVDDQDKSKFAIKITPPLFKSPFTDDLAKSLCLEKYRQQREEARLNPGSHFNLDLNVAYNTYTACLKTDGLKGRLLKMNPMIEEMKFWDDMSDRINRTDSLSKTITNTNILLDIINMTEGIPDPASLRSQILNKEYETFTLEELFNGTVFKEQFINWTQLVTHLFGEDEKGRGYTLHVYSRRGLSKVFNKLREERDFDPGEFRNIMLMLWSERLYNDLVEPVNEVARSESYCYRATVNLMKDFTSFLYLDTLENKEAKIELIQNMIDFNKRAAKNMMSRTEGTEEMISKLDQMKGNTANIEDIRNILLENLEDNEYGTKVKNMPGNFVAASMMLLRRYRSMLYKTLPLQPEDSKQLWRQFLLPHSHSGVVIYALNQFLIPFGALEAPLYHPDVPAYLNYAGVGHMIAHELMHSFDSTGIQYSESDRMGMTIPDIYQDKSECIAESLETQKSHISNTNFVSLYTMKKNLKLNEVLADSGAARLAWEAYLLSWGQTGNARRRRSLDWYPTPIGGGRVRRQASEALPTTTTTEKRLPWLDLSPIQLFFLRIAQNQCGSSSELDMITVMESEHLSPSLRVNFIFKNDPLFAEAFKCKPAQPMRLTHQCSYQLG